MLNRNRFGAHGDVMSASPGDEAGKTALLEEIKSRARFVRERRFGRAAKGARGLGTGLHLELYTRVCDKALLYDPCPCGMCSCVRSIRGGRP